jgi:hypothetical protein
MLAGFIGGLLIYFGWDATETENIIALVVAFGSIITYIFGEGVSDGKVTDNAVTYIPFDAMELLKKRIGADIDGGNDESGGR